MLTSFFCIYNYSCLTQACTLHQNNSDSLFQCSTGPMGPCLPFSSLSETCTLLPLSSHVPLTPSTFLYSIHRNLPHLNYPPASPTKWKSQKGGGHVSTLFTGHTQHRAWHIDTCWMHEIIYSQHKDLLFLRHLKNTAKNREQYNNHLSQAQRDYC